VKKILFAISVVTNLVLVATVVGVMPLLLTISFIIITLLSWYIFRLTNQSKEMVKDLDSFYSNLEDFEKHLDEVHGLEMFYGDQNLQGLLKHSRTLLNEMYDFQEKYQINEEIDFDETEEDPPP
tara:strand:- start:103 stop:474 length:372 start_codon:yes stop_codon:yes gene_type:complete